MVWETQRVGTNSIQYGRQVFCGDFISSSDGAVAGGKRDRKELSSPGVSAEGSNWQENPSGGSECVSVKTGTLSRKSLVCGQPVRHVNTRTHPAPERKLPLTPYHSVPTLVDLSAISISAGTDVMAPFFH